MKLELEPTPAATVEPLSPLRQRFADRQRELASVEKAVADQLALAARLDPIVAAVGPAKAALATFDAEQSAGYARWASSLTTGRPTSAGARRAELVAEIEDAEQAASAATAAQDGFRHASIRAGAPLHGLRTEIAEVERLLILEDASELLAPIADAVATFWRLRKQALAARLAAVIGADLSQFRELALASAKFADAQAVAEAVPVDDEEPRIFHLPKYADDAARQMRAIMASSTNYSSANPVA